MSSNTIRIRRKLVIVGDGACGKTCLLTVFTRNEFPPEDEYIPTTFESSVKDMMVDGRWVELALWDTAGQETFDRLRTLSYPDSDVVLIAFSIGAPETLGNVTEKWIPEVHYHCPDLPFLLVGCKSDLRDDPKTIEELKKEGLRPVTQHQGRAVSDEIGAWGYVECSAKLNINVYQVFDTAVRAALRPRKKRRSKSRCFFL